MHRCAQSMPLHQTQTHCFPWKTHDMQIRSQASRRDILCPLVIGRLRANKRHRGGVNSGVNDNIILHSTEKTPDPSRWSHCWEAPADVRMGWFPSVDSGGLPRPKSAVQFVVGIAGYRFLGFREMGSCRASSRHHETRRLRCVGPLEILTKRTGRDSSSLQPFVCTVGTAATPGTSCSR